MKYPQKVGHKTFGGISLLDSSFLLFFNGIVKDYLIFCVSTFLFVYYSLRFFIHYPVVNREDWTGFHPHIPSVYFWM